MIFITIAAVDSLGLDLSTFAKIINTILIIANTNPDLIAPIVVLAIGTSKSSIIPNASESIAIALFLL